MRFTRDHEDQILPSSQSILNWIVNTKKVSSGSSSWDVKLNSVILCKSIQKGHYNPKGGMATRCSRAKAATWGLWQPPEVSSREGTFVPFPWGKLQGPQWDFLRLLFLPRAETQFEWKITIKGWLEDTFNSVSSKSHNQIKKESVKWYPLEMVSYYLLLFIIHKAAFTKICFYKPASILACD